MFRILCLFVVVAVVAGMPHAPEWQAPGPVPMGRIVKREAQGPLSNGPANDQEPGAAVAAEDDMDKAETFGFGYHHYYAYPRYYYPSYYHGYYPRYHYGYYW
ncbi:uncharacterized protein LOC128724656 [Anopheles nili]|uniref:uncharacterized protein LOC128724656 n=1 Tax=Anopheles nili TaxID=185578 RepID=UPI00237A5F97|nr:uncharacterized protein LOC128724656 [Anopheles nili]